MHGRLTRRRMQFLLAASALCPALAVRANDYPSRAVRMVLPVGTGGGGDTLGRAIAEHLSAIIGQPVVVDNRPGADGLIAMQSLLSAPADGYTMLLIGPQPMVFNPLLRSDLPYQPSDLLPLTGVFRSWTTLVTGPDSRFGNFAELAAAVRAGRDTVSLGTSGLSYRVGATLLGSRLDSRFLQISYKSFPQILNDLVGGVLDVALVDTTPIVPLQNAGKLRALAVAAPQRLPLLPGVPTIHESGVDFDFALWTALAVRAGTPAEHARRLEADLHKALTSPGLTDFVAKLGTTELWPVSGADIAAEVAAGLSRFKAPVAQVAADVSVEQR
ncbi:tripartite tricarboxylate transporter substrate binding protein [Verticiella sediminum]|uniref:Tripartite tricarboxylate transporter substrate binding protein n=1 Tax=Verticiella sediminum TaxID=1247510 RepID=A0A556B0W8_9BURK|nr:tripartite tricarboxylate transporter substrate binding protein [Verticiella sediminum]TSH98809.1 tripartite tricarboxylate transporter substrate binding protein [Verticiella sediminum]